MKDGKFSVGVIGLNGRGKYLVSQQMMDLQNSYLTCVCDIIPERVDAALQQFGSSVTGYTNVDDFLKHPDLDAVYIAASDKAHAELAKKVLAAKKHLYLEKPMAQSIEDCDSIIDAWEGSGTVFFVGLELRYCTLFRDMKEIISRGDIGKIKIASVVDNVSVGGNYFFHNQARKKSFIKSLVLQKGTHSLDIANWMIDDSPRRVFASGAMDVFGGREPEDKTCDTCTEKDTCPYFRKATFRLDYGGKDDIRNDYCVYSKSCDVSDNSLVIVDYENGTRLSYMECHFTPEYTREFTFIGDKGKLTGFYNNEQEFKIMVWKRFEDKPQYYYPEKVEGEGISSHGGGDYGILKSFSSCIHAGKPCMVGIKGARDSAAIAIAAAESEETGLPVWIPKSKVLEGAAR